jgi:hypothetical protein
MFLRSARGDTLLYYWNYIILLGNVLFPMLHDSWRAASCTLQNILSFCYGNILLILEVRLDQILFWENIKKKFFCSGICEVCRLTWIMSSGLWILVGFVQLYSPTHRVHIFTRDETGFVYLPTQLEHTLQLYWWW